MRRVLCHTVLALAAALTAAGCPVTEDGGVMLVQHPDGTTTLIEDCKTGCNAPTADETHALDPEAYQQALVELAALPVGAESLAIDTLLFHFEDLPGLRANFGTDPLSPQHVEWIDRELSRTEVRAVFELIGDDGALLGRIDTVIPLKHKQHLVLQGTGALKRIEVNGKTKRVGLHHLWSRW